MPVGRRLAKTILALRAKLLAHPEPADAVSAVASNHAAAFPCCGVQPIVKDLVAAQRHKSVRSSTRIVQREPNYVLLASLVQCVSQNVAKPIFGLFVVVPFIMGSVQMTKLTWSQRLQETCEVVGAKPLSKGNKFMINRRLVLGMIAAATAIDASRIAFAKEKHHLNGKDLLGENIKKNGKHKIHTTGKKVDVFAEVNSGKVTAVTAAGMQVKKVKSRQKLADATPGITLVSMQLAQADVYYYGYWVYDDLTDTYIWFPADYVIVDSSWVEYVP